MQGAGWFGLTMLGINLVPASREMTPVMIAPEPRFARDDRAKNLKAFFDAYQCPQPRHVEEYIKAADAYGLDYRLLPALSVRESTCGRHARMNNRWGWDSARTGFASVARGIEYVARQLAWGRSYRDKDLDGKLHTYNPNPLYPGEVKRLMQEIETD